MNAQYVRFGRMSFFNAVQFNRNLRLLNEAQEDSDLIDTFGLFGAHVFQVA